MSVIFNATTEAAKRTANLVAGSSDYTCLFYVKFTSTPAGVDYQTPFIAVNGVATYTQFAGFFRYDDGTLHFQNNNATTGSLDIIGPALSEDIWYRVAYVRQGTTHRFYLQEPDGALTLIGSGSLSFSAVTLSEYWIGDDTFSVSGIEIGYFREWDNDLSITELLTEFRNLDTSQDPGNINGDWPLTANLDDDSGLNHDWTAVGSLTFDAAEPAFPANNTRDTAEEIATLPFSDTQDVFINGFAYPVWYKYETQPDDIVLNLWGYANPLTPYQVITKGYKDGLTEEIFTSSGGGFPINKPVRLSVLQGSTYYFEFSISGNVALSEAELLIEAQTHTPQVVPIGSILVNEDNEFSYFPTTFISGINGDNYNTLRYINEIAIGEGGDTLENGIILLCDRTDGNLKLYESDLTFITNIAVNIGTTRALRTCYGTQTFFVAAALAGPPKAVSEIDGTGAIVDIWSMTSVADVQAICANNDKTILYNSSTAAGPVRRWDLVNDIALSDFVPTLAGGYRVIDILILADDSILVSWQIIGGGDTSDFIVKRYDAAATLLNTYTFPSQFIVGAGACRMAYAVDNPNSFWVWLHDSGSGEGISRFKNIKISDGSVLSEIESIEYYSGSYGPDATLTPISRDGITRSCPFLITRVAIPLEGTGTLIVRKTTVPPGSAQTFDVEIGGGLSPDTLVMQDGDEETYVDVPAGDGYSVEEINLPEGWSIVGYEVSNGSPHDNISIAVDEEVIVTIVNSTGGGGIFRVPTIPTNPQTPPQRFDDFPADGEITPVKIPTPFFTTALIQDK